jgi:hypothetical protein
MPNERVIEIPWMLQSLPQTGRVLDIGSCGAVYLGAIHQPDRELHCLDPRDCPRHVPAGAVFHRSSLIGNDLPRGWFDAVVVLSVLEHIGLPCYGQDAFPGGDRLALAEIGELLKPGAPVLVTVPAGQSKVASWYRQYSPADLGRLFAGWRSEISYWGFDGEAYRPISEGEVEELDYRDRQDLNAGAGAMAAILAYRP